MGFEENEISQNANGGTEIAKRMLGDIIDPFVTHCESKSKINESR